ncbi:hypothetical protein U9M48_023579 [Paspalum notatum var. saurae]|uniref:DUF4216 domain-containing protein n=1 Tax=Paspalum notatum var. saurae TaxID=547442 RepID=A0AAQ3WVW3_PASNO
MWETIHNRPRHINDIPDQEEMYLSIFSSAGRPLGGRKTRDLDMDELQQAHIYVLRNCDEVQSFISEYINITEDSQIHQFTALWNRNFIAWFKEKIHNLQQNDTSQQIQDLLSLARGPLSNITCFSGYDVNGYRFRIERRDRNRCTQNCGVIVFTEGSTDREHVNYYGILTEIIELQFLGGRCIPLFRCKWVDIFNKNRGIKTDIYGLVSVNFKCLLRTNEPFVLTTQASQVFFVKDNLIKGWDLVVKMQPRDTYDVPSVESDDEVVGPTDDDGDEEDIEEQPTIPSCIQYAKGKHTVKRTYPSKDITNECNSEVNNSIPALLRTATRVESIANMKMSKFASQPAIEEDSNDSEEKQEMEDWNIWNRTAKKFKSTNKNLDAFNLENGRDVDGGITQARNRRDEGRTQARNRRDEGRNIARDRTRGQRRNEDISEDEIMNRCQQMPLAREGCVFEGSAYPRNDDNDILQPTDVEEQQSIAPRGQGDKTTKKIGGRGKNKCKAVADLKPREKIKVVFYNNRALSKTFSRHLGRLVRDTNITPIRVKKWSDISATAVSHIYDAVTDKFENGDPNIDIDMYKTEIMEHARDLWHNWREDLNRHYVKPTRNMQQALKNCPKGIKTDDWEWLVKEHFYRKDFIAEIELERMLNPSLSSVQLMDKCFPSNRRDHVVGYGGGIKAKDIRTPSLSKSELIEKLTMSEAEKRELLQNNRDLREDNEGLHEENRVINNRVSHMEEEWAVMKQEMARSRTHHHSE